jgi:hypothetical protein
VLQATGEKGKYRNSLQTHDLLLEITVSVPVLNKMTIAMVNYNLDVVTGLLFKTFQ